MARRRRRVASKKGPSVTAEMKAAWALANPEKVAQGWRLDSGGYVIRTVYINGRRNHQREHRVVMEELLGRKLRPGENIHHRNGVRHDNDTPGNLELFVVAQPSGQRPEDLLAWAYEIIARYGEPIDL